MDNLLFILYVITTLMVVGVLPLLEALGGGLPRRRRPRPRARGDHLVAQAALGAGRGAACRHALGRGVQRAHYLLLALDARGQGVRGRRPDAGAPVRSRVGGRAHTLWVDPGDPSRLLPPSWRERLAAYLLWAPVALSVGLGDLGWRWEPGMRLLSLMVSHPLESMLAIGATAACVELWWSRL